MVKVTVYCTKCEKKLSWLDRQDARKFYGKRVCYPCYLELCNEERRQKEAERECARAN